jgi:hypothetical protein
VIRRLFIRIVLLVLLLLCCGIPPAMAQRLSPLAATPDWSRLEAMQETITRAEFMQLLDTVFAPGGAWNGVIEATETEAVIFKTLSPPDSFRLRFAASDAARKLAPRYWRSAETIPVGKRVLSNVRLVLDPGHIGGKWGLMEERSFAQAGDKPVQEGDMTLLVCQLAAKKLRALGADVRLTRESAAPASPANVDALRPQGRKELELLGVTEFRENYDGPRDPQKPQTVQWQAEKLFYRVAEIRERAKLVNETLKPDLVVCVHFNADDWIDPEAPVFTERNDLHTLIHGAMSASELRFDDQRFEMLQKLLTGAHLEELRAATAVNDSLVKATGLPPFTYTTGNAVRVNANEFLWARNLLANRLFNCPVIFLEPYRMNHAGTYARIQAGDYEGQRDFGGTMRPSIFREYADAIVEGLVSHYSNLARPVAKVLPLPGETFSIEGRPAFVIPSKNAPPGKPKPWVWYAPTLDDLPSSAERWMFEQFLEAGIGIAGIDVGESYGSPVGRKLYSALYTELTQKRGYAPKMVLLGRSRGGLMTLSWAADNADKIAGFAGIYPVCNVASYPGVAKAAGAYGLSPEQLESSLSTHNPIDRLAPLAAAKVPFFAIHGDVDKTVPLEANSELVKSRYIALGGSMELIIPKGQGHNMWSGFFKCEELVAFVMKNARR